MKVQINSGDKYSHEQLNKLYNIIKRSEEDLHRRSLPLVEIIVDISKIATNVASNFYGINAAHSFTDDGTQLLFKFRYRTEPTIDQMSEMMEKEIKKIRDTYYPHP